jgi:hypothetical protein
VIRRGNGWQSCWTSVHGLDLSCPW